MIDCINLKDQFGDRFRIELDPAHYAERGKNGRLDDPWLQILPCQRGHIYPHGGDMLGVATNSRGSTATALAGLAGVTVVQDGDDGINAIFHVSVFDQVANLIRPRRKRRLSPERRAAALDRLAKYQFSSARQNDFGGQECDEYGTSIPEHVPDRSEQIRGKKIA